MPLLKRCPSRLNALRKLHDSGHLGSLIELINENSSIKTILFFQFLMFRLIQPFE
jgi:hypothetical protein